MSDIISRIRSGEVLVSDGAMGTMLIREGLKAGDCPEKVNLERPEVLENIARLYLEAGAQIIHTNTFGGSPVKLAYYGLDKQTEEINRIAVESVRRAVNDKAYIAASCGPCGQLIKPYGEADEQDVYDSFKIQLEALVDAGVDMITVETMTDIAEAQLAIKAAKSISQSIPVAATMTFDSTPRGFYTIMGNSIEDAANGLAEAGADILGANCGHGIENMVKIAEQFKKYSSLPILIQSNAGLPILKGDDIEYPESPEFMAERCEKLLELGVNIIGGCCGTTPEHIAAIAEVVNCYNKS